LGASLTLLGFGCATGGSELRHGIGAGQWEARLPLPTTQSPIQALAYGSGGSSERAADLGVSDALAALDSTPVGEPLMAAEAAPLRVASRRSKPVPVVVAAAPAALTQVAEPAQSATPTPTELASRVQVQEPMTLAANASDNRYAEREAQAQEQQKFAGGDAIVITSGAILLVLLVVLLILLLR
jgi:hypothetical protein